MDVCAGKVLIKAGLCLGLLFRLLLWRAQMGLRARLDDMQSHCTAQQWKKQRLQLAKNGLGSLCPPDSTVVRAPDGCRSILEDRYRRTKESLLSSRFLHRSALPPKVAPKKPAFPYHPLGGSHPHDVLPRSMDREDCHSHDFQLMDDHICRIQQQPSPSVEILPSSTHSSTALALVDMDAFIHEQRLSVATAKCEPSTQPSSSNAIVFSQDEQIHREPMPAARETPHEECSIIKITGSAAGTGGELSKQEPVYKQLLERIRTRRDTPIKELKSDIEVEEALLENLRRTRQALSALKRRDIFQTPLVSAALTPLSEEEEEEVRQALNGANRHEVLVQHEPSNIDLSRSALQCLKPGAWLNDEVINLYMELLKERECREQKNYLKCHFFNTFFFNKLYKDARSYDYKAVRRWTTLKKLGYSLLECDKIFVPIHKDIHWCLAVINLREKKLQYLDSLKGQDVNALQALARYIRDEAKDKGGQNVDTSSWELECPKDIPEQMNGCDCGMFMIKYADFLSRGEDLKFTQEHMTYFRKRTVLELLQLKAR